MPDNLAASTAELERLLKLIMKETDPVKYDQLGSEIWRVLTERELLIKEMSQPINQVPEPSQRVA